MRPDADRICRWALWTFGAAYFAALALYGIGERGLFGQPRDPLAGVFLVLLGLPWNRAVDLAPEPLWPWLAAAAPALNLLLLFGIWRLAHARSWKGHGAGPTRAEDTPNGAALRPGNDVTRE
jgi:hypothetical protein